MKTDKLKKLMVDEFVKGVCMDSDDPYLGVVESYPGVSVPEGFSREGIIVLNMAAHATFGYHADDDAIYYSAKFNGRPFDVVIPYSAVAIMYPRSSPRAIVALPVDIGKMEEATVTSDKAKEVKEPVLNDKANADWAKNATVH